MLITPVTGAASPYLCAALLLPKPLDRSGCPLHSSSLASNLLPGVWGSSCKGCAAADVPSSSRARVQAPAWRSKRSGDASRSRLGQAGAPGSGAAPGTKQKENQSPAVVRPVQHPGQLSYGLADNRQSLSTPGGPNLADSRQISLPEARKACCTHTLGNALSASMHGIKRRGTKPSSVHEVVTSNLHAMQATL